MVGYMAGVLDSRREVMDGKGSSILEVIQLYCQTLLTQTRVS